MTDPLIHRLRLLGNSLRRSLFPVKVFENKRNLGYVKNFEQAIARCNGDVIFFCDQDDIWHVEKIERCLEVFDTNPDVGLV